MYMYTDLFSIFRSYAMHTFCTSAFLSECFIISIKTNMLCMHFHYLIIKKIIDAFFVFFILIIIIQ